MITKMERFLVSIAQKVVLTSEIADKDWKEKYLDLLAATLEERGIDPESSIEEDYDEENDAVILYFLTDEYKTAYEQVFRGYPLPEGAIIEIGKDFETCSKEDWECDIFSAGDKIKVSTIVFNDRLNCIDYYLRAFDETEQPISLVLTDDFINGVLAEGYYDDKLIDSGDSKEFSVDDVSAELDTLNLY